MQKYIEIKGARENNLKNINLKLPKEKLIVMTGLSGSGKTSLAFDTIYAEGQRRYVESLSAYARQFLGNLNKPDVDSIEGLSPAISIDQKTTSKNPRSTVGTVTEIYDYLRLLYARVGDSYCPTHGVLISAQTIPQMIEKLFEHPEESRVMILAPIVVGQKGRHEKTLELIQKEGFSRIRVDGVYYDLSETEELDKNIRHSIDVVVDRIKLRDDICSRLFASLEVALRLGEGKVTLDINGEEVKYSEFLSCPHCDFSIPKLEPRLFSFNSPFGACPTCKGLGYLQQIDYDLLVTEPTKSIREGAIRYLKNIVDTENIEWQVFRKLTDFYGIDLDIPYQELSPEHQEIIMKGSKEPISYEITSRGMNTFRRTDYIEGIADLITRRYRETNSSYARDYYNSYQTNSTCPTCGGKKLSVEALSVKIGGLNIHEFSEMTILEAWEFVKNLKLDETKAQIAHLVLKEIIERLDFLIQVGLDYLTLNRSSGSLSGGESQRIRLATQIGSHLSGVLYVLDEPSIGLHQRDNDRLIGALKKMRDLGNTLIVVEHDEDIMRQADYLVDIGPYAGVHGGEVIACGTPEEVMACPNSITGKYLSHQLSIPIPEKRRAGNGKFLTIHNGYENNLRHIDVRIPLGKMVLVTGVSGSGKSSLVNDILVKSLQKSLYRSKETPGKHDYIEGIEAIDKIVEIDQSPIGRTPRSNPATYTGVFDQIRNLFAETIEAKVRGYGKGRFSFNIKGGRCERCCGDGVLRIEMHFLPDVYVPCEECHGTRYNHETLEVFYKGKNIYDVLEMTIEDACSFFENIPPIKIKLDTLKNVGLGYIKLGQSATTLSGGEAQRVKLASELYKKISGQTLYILDEPTTGLHSDDVKKLIGVLNYLVDQGATVIMIEHNLDVIKQADHIIDLGPEGGYRGGEIIFEGSAEEIIHCEKSYTGQYLRRVMK
ncbi:MAG: excinuclease ABC subunit UvrA [Bacilli bacterium]|nr:excinuclease ABC subunit UvrA [Bacilli bacterium]